MYFIDTALQRPKRANLSHQTRKESFPASWGRKRHPWRSPSSAWHARCKSQRRGWRSPRRSSKRLWSPRRSTRWSSSLPLFLQDAGWPAWWCPECYHGGPSDDALLLPSRVPCPLFHDLTLLTADVLREDFLGSCSLKKITSWGFWLELGT